MNKGVYTSRITHLSVLFSSGSVDQVGQEILGDQSDAHMRGDSEIEGWESDP